MVKSSFVLRIKFSPGRQFSASKSASSPSAKTLCVIKMTDIQTISWIFLATAMATNTKPTGISGISLVADGINHAVPTQKELQTSISWLTRRGLIIKQGRNYELTSKGKLEYQTASKNTQTIMKIWENIELNFNSYGNK